ncbi:MAG: radical SAM protein [Anaerolineae bacterium]|nr:radical SAM protein [Anaerolineae bacterium]
MNPYLTVNRIEFLVTYRCNSHCKHCQVGPAARASRPPVIDAGLAARIVGRVCEAYTPSSAMTFGGEPLLFPDVVCAVHGAARAGGIEKRQVITNAGWPRSGGEFRTVAAQLAESGVNSVCISVDAFHQETIPVPVVERNVRALVDVGIEVLEWNPCWVVSKEHDNPWNGRTRAVLDALSHLPVVEDDGNVVQPEGYARTWLREYLPAQTAAPEGSCGDMPYTGQLDQVGSISVEPDGGIAVCDEWIIGNAAQRDVVDILRDYDPVRIPEMKAILGGGIAGLVELARARGIEPDPGGYYSVCDRCRSIRRRLRAVPGMALGTD